MPSIKKYFLPIDSAIHIDAIWMGESILNLEVTGSNVQLLLNILSALSADPDENCHILCYFIWVFTVWESTGFMGFLYYRGNIHLNNIGRTFHYMCGGK